MKNNHLIKRGALVALAGFILSGPLGLLAVNLVKPQPAWSGAANFVAGYHAIQTVPFLFGFLLVGGMLTMIAGHYIVATGRQRSTALLSLVFAIPFSTLIFFNYIVQVSFIPNLVMNYESEYNGAITSFSMSSPLSLCWNIEMWGYALLGVATWILAGYYKGLNSFIRFLLIANGILSLAGALFTLLDINWLMTTAGLLGYTAWNLLMMVMMVAVYRHAKRHEKDLEIEAGISIKLSN